MHDCDLSDFGDKCSICESIKEFTIKRKADAAHKIWAHWMQYQFTQGGFDDVGNFIIPFDKVERWQRQMNTDFFDLTDQEQKSDFEIAGKFMRGFD